MKRNKWPVIFATPFLTAYGLFMLFPMLYSFYLSLFEYNGIVEKHFVGFSNYINLFTKDKLFLKSLFNTVFIMLMSLPVNLILGLVVAYLLFSLVRGRRVFQVVNFLPYITTPVAIGFIFSYIFDWNSGILNGLLTHFGILEENYFWLQQPWSARLIVALMIVWRNFGYCMMIYLSGMTAIDQDIYEAAAIDGAGKLKTFFAIVVPLLKNVSVFLLITAMIGGFQMFDEPVQLYSGWSAASRSVGGPEYSVLTVIWKFYDDSFGSNTRLGYGAAIAYTLFLIIGACSLFSFFWSNRKDS
jgi:multiple sugar transport system permease protein/cellobiose transport system permease protein